MGFCCKFAAVSHQFPTHPHLSTKMAYTKIVILSALVALALAAPQQPAGVEEYDLNPQYQYSYQIQDPLTGDSKSASESRQGDSVQGSYSLVDADGSTRTVEYTADPASGFQAVVKKNGQPVLPEAPKVVPVKSAKSVLVHAPIAYHPAPAFAYHAPTVYHF